MKRFVFTTIVLCTLTLPVIAGQIPSDGRPAPEPTPTPAASAGDIQSDGLADQFSTDVVTALISALTFLTV
jgi:hypothetical protein